MVTELDKNGPAQRVTVDLDLCCGERRVKIRTESYDAALGWYVSGSLTLPLSELPLLEQSLAEMHAAKASHSECQIIPFPGRSEVETTLCSEGC